MALALALALALASTLAAVMAAAAVAAVAVGGGDGGGRRRCTCWRCGKKATPHAWISSSALSDTSSSSRPILEPNVRATAAIESMNFLVATCVWNAVWQFFTRVSVSVRLAQQREEEEVVEEEEVSMQVGE